MMEGLCEAKLKKQSCFSIYGEKLVLLCSRVIISKSERNVARMLIIGCQQY